MQQRLQFVLHFSLLNIDHLTKGIENHQKNNIVTRKVCWDIGDMGLNLLRLAELEVHVSISCLDKCSNHHNAKKAVVASLPPLVMVPYQLWCMG